MTHQSEDGLRIKALVARTNVPLPPPAGVSRTHHCLREGVLELFTARRLGWRSDTLLHRALASPEVGGVLPGGGALRVGVNRSFVRDDGASRVVQWFALRGRAFKYFKLQLALNNVQPFRDYKQAEEAIRSAMKASGRSYLWLKDVAFDMDLATSIKLHRGESTLGELLEEAHASLHRFGEIYGGLYGCEFAYEDGVWFQECDVHLPHVPIANSMGFTCRYMCTVCGEDASSCQHARGVSYEVKVRRPEAACSLCAHSQENCEHQDGEIVKVVANGIITDINIREFSMVHRARDPLARITSVEVSALDLADRLGRMPVAGETVLCHTCMYPCQHNDRVKRTDREVGISTHSPQSSS